MGVFRVGGGVWGRPLLITSMTLLTPLFFYSFEPPKKLSRAGIQDVDTRGTRGQDAGGEHLCYHSLFHCFNWKTCRGDVPVLTKKCSKMNKKTHTFFLKNCTRMLKVWQKRCKDHENTKKNTQNHANLQQLHSYFTFSFAQKLWNWKMFWNKMQYKQEQKLYDKSA